MLRAWGCAPSGVQGRTHFQGVWGQSRVEVESCSLLLSEDLSILHHSACCRDSGLHFVSTFCE